MLESNEQVKELQQQLNELRTVVVRALIKLIQAPSAHTHVLSLGDFDTWSLIELRAVVDDVCKDLGNAIPDSVMQQLMDKEKESWHTAQQNTHTISEILDDIAGIDEFQY